MIDPAQSAGMKVTVMGLGLHGGGLASALFFAKRGAMVTVTDLRPREALQSSIDRLSGFPVRYVLGSHDEADFAGADLVIKNPAVPPASPFLAAARAHGVAVETDLSVFLSLAKNPVIAVTGSKGKSTTASAIAFGLSRIDPAAKLGGNITVSPLTFLEELGPRTPVVLELSSWQLGDLKGRGILAPAVSVFTVIMPDHLDKYPGMTEYVADKKVIFEAQGPDTKAIFNLDDPWQKGFAAQTRAQAYHFSASPLPEGARGAWLEEGQGFLRLSEDPDSPRKAILADARIPGQHNRMNLICAGLALSLFGVKAEVVRKALAEFPGVEHRLEMFREWRGIRFYNDSAATIPQATVQALKSLDDPVVLVMGGTDKNIDFSPLAEVIGKPRAVVLLAGTGTDKIRPLLDAAGVTYDGPFGELAPAVETAIARAQELAASGVDAGGAIKHRGRSADQGAAAPRVNLLFSPGCTSFGMFLNEFDRGRRFKETVAALTP